MDLIEIKDKNKTSKVLRRVSDRNNKKRPVPFDCLVKILSSGKKSKKCRNKLRYNAYFKFPRGIEPSKLTLRSGLYFLSDKIVTTNDKDKQNDNNRKTNEGNEDCQRKQYVKRQDNGLFVLNPSNKAILPVLGVAMAISDVSKFKDKILIFNKKRLKPKTVKKTNGKKRKNDEKK